MIKDKYSMKHKKYKTAPYRLNNGIKHSVFPCDKCKCVALFKSMHEAQRYDEAHSYDNIKFSLHSQITTQRKRHERVRHPCDLCEYAATT